MKEAKLEMSERNRAKGAVCYRIKIDTVHEQTVGVHDEDEFEVDDGCCCRCRYGRI